MGCVRKRRGTWVVDARLHGRRVVKACRTRREAEEALAKLTAEQRQRTRPAVDPFIKLADYVPRFLADCREQEVEEGTARRYERTLKNHILPTLGATRLRDLTRSDIRALVLAKRQDGVNLQGQKGDARTPKGPLGRATVAQIRSVLSSVLSLAVEDELLGSNPALGVGRKRRTKAARIRNRAQAGEKVKAMDRDQRNRFLALAAVEEPEIYPAFLLGSLAGLRLGELLGLKWNSVDFNARRLWIHEQIGSATTKTGTERQVDMAGPLVSVLRELRARRREVTFRAGQAESPWVVLPSLPEKPDAKQQQNAEKRVRRAMERVVRLAGLPPHFTPHSLRHTFCSLLISSGVSPVYVQQQAGHASVEMTVAVYGSWFAVEAVGAMDRLAAGVPGSGTGNIRAESGNNLEIR